MKKQSEKNLFSGKWISLTELTFKTKNNQIIYWEGIKRINTHIILVIVPIIKPHNQYILIKQFRPSVNNVVIGFPAGILDLKNTAKNSAKIDIETQALKELKEETGYTGIITDISPELVFNPALSNERVYIVSAEIDANNPLNLHPVQQLEPAEEIDVVLVDKVKIKEYLIQERKNGLEIGVALWYLFGIPQF
ncbi:MAG: NUDIX hydrolase [Candidatus Omnitrophota bacterium]